MICSSFPPPSYNPVELNPDKGIATLKDKTLEVPSKDLKFLELPEESRKKIKAGINRIYALFAEKVLAQPSYREKWTQQIATSEGKILHVIGNVFNQDFINSINPILDSFKDPERFAFATRLTFQLRSFFGPFKADGQSRCDLVENYANSKLFDFTLLDKIYNPNCLNIKQIGPKQAKVAAPKIVELTKVCLEQPLAYWEEDYYYPLIFVSAYKNRKVKLDLIQVRLTRVCNAMRWDFDEKAQRILKHYCPEAEIKIKNDGIPCKRVTASLTYSQYETLSNEIREANPKAIFIE